MLTIFMATLRVMMYKGILTYEEYEAIDNVLKMKQPIPNEWELYEIIDNIFKRE